MRNIHLVLILTGLFVIQGCGGDDGRLISSNADGTQADEDGSEHGHDGDYQSAHGEVHDFNFAVGQQQSDADFEAGADMGTQVVTPDAAFRGVKLMITASRLDLEYRVVHVDGETTSWQRLDADQSVDRFHNGHLALFKDASEFHFRSTSPMDYLRLEFFDQPVDSADSHDDEGLEEDVRRQALAQPGRYEPPADVREAGLAQKGNFSYESAPAWSGGSNCTGTFLPGAKALGNFLVSKFEGAAYFQGYNCRQVRGSSSMSMHGTGRAIDVFVPEDSSEPYHNQADNDLGDKIANYLIENATELGVQYFIWDQASWSISRGVTRNYSGQHPHHDHLHIELTSSAAGAAADDFPSSFNPHFADDDDSPHEDAINAIYDEGITRGCASDPDPLYCPDDTESRANLAVMLMRAFDLPRADRDYFRDDDGMNAEDAINALAASGVNSRCTLDSDRKFCPEEKVTRGQFALWLDGLLDLEDTAQDYFADDSGSTYEGAVNRLAAAGITRGCSQDSYCGGELITRAEVASMLACSLDLVGCGEAAEPNRPVEIVLEWSSDSVDLDLAMHAPAEVDYRDRSPTPQGWMHSGDACPEGMEDGCHDTLVDGAFSENIWLAPEGAFGGDLPEATLERGDRGAEVEALQEALNHAGFDVGTVDGIYGGMTQEGVEALQATDDGVPVTGVYDEPTRQLLTDTLTPSGSYHIEVETFGVEESSSSFEVHVLRDGQLVESFEEQAAALGESRSFEFNLESR
ncbi:MAG: peptidoglycan-binding domain-containing protein [Persicimonas sp.]